MSDEALIRENIRKKEKARAALKEAAEYKERAEKAEAALKELQTKYDTLQNTHAELEDEVNAYLDEADANPPAPLPEEVMAELATYRRQDKLTKIQTALDSSGKFRKGTKAEHLARIGGIDIDDLTSEDLKDMDALTARWVELATKEAPVFLGEAEPEGSARQEQATGRPSALPAARRLPTFTGMAQGGGTPPPADQPLAIERLRDPAAALARANAARKQAYEQA